METSLFYYNSKAVQKTIAQMSIVSKINTFKCSVYMHISICRMLCHRAFFPIMSFPYTLFKACIFSSLMMKFFPCVCITFPCCVTLFTRIVDKYCKLESLDEKCFELSLIRQAIFNYNCGDDKSKRERAIAQSITLIYCPFHAIFIILLALSALS